MTADEKIKILTILVGISNQLEDKGLSISKFFEAHYLTFFDNMLMEIDEAIASILGGEVTAESVSDYLYESRLNQKNIEDTIKGLLDLEKIYDAD